MPSVGQPARSANFLVALLRRGAPVIADIPAEVPAAATDPTPVPGWQRISLIARDHGAAFSEADRPAGFGINSSITARLAEVGGRALVESSPGRGTRVTLWVPL